MTRSSLASLCLPDHPDQQLELGIKDELLNASGTPAPTSLLLKRLYIQDALLKEGLMAVKLSAACRSLEDLHVRLIDSLGQNSLETRRRYVQSITKWFFLDGIDGLLPKVWRTYADEAIIIDLLRWSYLAQEAIMGTCVADALFPLASGIAVPPSYFDKFLANYLTKPPPEKTRERLKINLKRLGFLERARGKPDRLLPVIPQKTSFLILLHHIFAPRSMRAVELRTLFMNPFWKYLGYKSEDDVRDVLHEADAAGVIGKYVVADQIEQVTTYSALNEWIEKGTRL
jgi:hypothetical protein